MLKIILKKWGGEFRTLPLDLARRNITSQDKYVSLQEAERLLQLPGREIFVLFGKADQVGIQIRASEVENRQVYHLGDLRKVMNYGK